MNIAAFTARHAADYEAQARNWRQEAQRDRKRADIALSNGDRAGHTRWLRQAAQCDQWARDSERAADDFAALRERVEVLA
jgi:hypothetical protein